MPTTPPDPLSLRLDGAAVLGPEALQRRPLAIEDGRLTEGAAGRSVDLAGYLILPGIVDLHGDGFERHLAPRRGALSDLGDGLRALDAELATNGLTTAYLAQFFSWEGGMRGPDYAEAVAEALAAATPGTDMRLQLRIEINLIHAYARALDLIARHGIGYAVFNDHLPHAALAAGKRPPRLTGQALKAGRAPEAHLALMQGLHDRRAEVPDALAALAADLRRMGVRLGSHDDRTEADRDRARALGARIAEFPETREATLAALKAGDPVLMGAPNVVRGGSHDRGHSAAHMVDAGAVDALVSDYHYPSLAHAAWRLHDGGMALQEAWALISARPAEVLGLTDRGHLAPGYRADLVMVNAETRAIEGTIAGGVVTHLQGALAARMIGGET